LILTDTVHSLYVEESEILERSGYFASDSATLVNISSVKTSHQQV